MIPDPMLAEAVADTYRAMLAAGLNRGASGNVSARCGDGFLITPSGRAAADTGAADIVPVGLDGEPRGAGRPSSEWRIHRDLYRARPEVNAVVHAHSPFAVSLACLRRAIPPFHYMVAVAGGHDIPCAEYATFGSQALSDHILAAMQDRNACLMANHGLVAVGADLAAALDLAVEVESLCEQYWRARLMGEPVLLDAAEMDRVLSAFADYRRTRR